MIDKVHNSLWIIKILPHSVLVGGYCQVNSIWPAFHVNPVPFLFPLWPRRRQCSLSFTAREKLILCVICRFKYFFPLLTSKCSKNYVEWMYFKWLAISGMIVILHLHESVNVTHCRSVPLQQPFCLNRRTISRCG